MKKRIVLIVVAVYTFISLIGCVSGPDRTPNIRDKDPFAKRVYGCAAGFGDEIAGKLVVEYEEAKKKGNAGIEAARKTAAAVLTLLPKEDRLEGYKVYTDCISKDIETQTISEKDALQMAVAACTGGFEANPKIASALNIKAEIDSVLLNNKYLIDKQASAIFTQSLGDLEKVDTEKYKLYIECVQSYYKLIKPNKAN